MHLQQDQILDKILRILIFAKNNLTLGGFQYCSVSYFIDFSWSNSSKQKGGYLKLFKDEIEAQGVHLAEKNISLGGSTILFI